MRIRSLFRVEKSEGIYSDTIISAKAKTAILFLHGIAGSRRYWNKDFHKLSDSYSLYFLDLLGFGFSAKPHTKYTHEAHTQAIDKFVSENVKEKQIILVGHSLGSILAIAYASRYPKQIKKLILLSLPYYESEEAAVLSIRSQTFPKYFVVDSFVTHLTCLVVCFFAGPITRRFGHYLLKHAPKEVISDGFLHSYNSYISTLYNVIYKQNIPSLLTAALCEKIFLIHGENDNLTPHKNVKFLAKKYKLPLKIIRQGNHGFPLTQTEEILEVINK